MTTQTASGSVTPAALVLAATTDTKIYDATTASSAAGRVVAGLAGADTATAITQSFDSRNAGTRTLGLTGYSVNDGNGGANYSVTTQTASGSITPAALVIAATAETKVYDATTTSVVAGHAPDAGQLQRLVDRHGPNLFTRSVEQRLLCCNVRKVQPLTRYLAGIDAWVTGLRRDQWAGRTDIRKVEIDHDHGAIVKLNPLAEWTEDEVWDYLRENDVPVHPLYAKGYTSIGCAPCTRPVAVGEPKRAGRWWWESNAPKECGMHCAIETGGFEHELHAIVGEAARG